MKNNELLGKGNIQASITLKGCDLCASPSGKEVYLRYPSYKALLCGHCFAMMEKDMDEFRRHWVKVRKKKE